VGLASGRRLLYGVTVLPSPLAVPVEPLLIAAVVVIGGVVAACEALAQPRRSSWHRAAGWSAVALLAGVWISPLQTVAAHYLLTAHLLQVMVVMGAVPPLLLLALPDRWPWPVPGAVARLGRALVHPVTGILAINVVFFAWHLSAAYDASLRSSTLYALQQLTLLAASFLFWWPIVVPLRGRRVLSRWSTLGYILVATIPQTFGGITVALAKHALYPTYDLAPRLFGVSVMTDQEIAGACLALVSKLALFTAFAVIFMRMLNEPAADGGDDGGGGGGRRPGADTPSPQPSGSVPWLAELNAGRTVPEPAPARPRVRLAAGAGSRRG
jgi:cytochrome c oxidase assembly factor CtaG